MSNSSLFKRVTIIAVIVLLLVGSLGMTFNTHPTALGSGENWLTSWSYRKSHVINGTGTTAGANYPEEINIYYMNYTSLGSVTTKAPMPTGLSDLPAATFNNKIYTFGGYGTSSGDVKNYVFSYDPSTDAWTQKTNMPTARWGPIAVEFNGLIYVFGGTASVNQVYDPTSDTWSTKNNLPTGFDQGLMGVRYGSTIQLFYKNLHYEYDPATDTYTSKANVPAPLTWGTCAYVNVGGEDRIYIIGGYSYNTGGGTNTVYYYRPAYDDWTTVSTTAPYAAYGTTRDNPVIGGKIYYGYGNSAGSSFFYSSMYAYDPAANTWTQLQSGTYPRDGVACGVVNGKLYVIGGRGVEGGPYGLTYNEVFDPNVQNAIVDNGPNVTANMECRTDFGDIRFTASDGVTQLSYWIQSYTSGVVATFWVKIADDLSGASSTIYMYYGNPSATTTSNGAAVWTIFDDFEGPTPLSNYAADIGSINSFTIATLGSNHVLSYTGPVGWFLLSRTTPTFQNMRMIATMMPHVSSGNYYTGLSFRETATTNWYFSWLAGAGGSLYAGSPDGPRTDWLKRVGTDTYIAGGPTNDFHNTWANMEVDMTGSSCKTYVNGVKKADTADTAITQAGKIGFMGLYASYWDNLAVGSYVNPEPAHGIWGPEQSYSSFGFSLLVTVIGSGSVGKSPDQTSYADGTVVTLTASASIGWTFAGWSGDASGTVNPTSVTMNANESVTATFTQNTYTLTASTVGSGSVNLDNGGPYHYGDVVHLTAVPSVGWSFSFWSGDLSGSSNPQALTITSNMAVTATFTLDQYTLSVTVVGGGSVDKNPDQGSYTWGTNVTLTATANLGWTFAGWSGDALGTGNPTTVNMTGSKAVTATFTQNTYTLTVNVVGSGVVNLNNNGPYHYGDTVQLTAVPSASWSFDHWSGDLGGSANPTVLTIFGNSAVTAHFVLPQLYVDPSSIQKGPGDTYTTFQTSIMVNKISDLKGFDIKLTWDDNLVTLTNVDFNTTLDNVWGHGNWYLAYNVTSAGYYELAAVSTSTSFTSTAATPLFALTFVVKAAVGQTSIHFALVKLSDSEAQSIQAEVTDGGYTVTGPQYLPVLQATPGSVTCRKYGEYFTVQLNITNAITLGGFDFTIYFSPPLIKYVSVSWGELGAGTITNVDQTNGIIEGHVAGTAISGNRWLLNITFQNLATMIWKQGQVNELDGQVWFHYAQLSFLGVQQLAYQEGGLDQISVNNVAFKFMPLQGDINNDGVVDISDLRTVAAYFDVKQGGPLWSAASAYDLNRNGVIDIYDLVLVGANFS